MSPRKRFQRPGTVRVFLLELLPQLAQHCVIVRRFVVAYTFPVQRFGRCLRVRITFEHLCIPALRVGPALTHKSNTSQA